MANIKYDQLIGRVVNDGFGEVLKFSYICEIWSIMIKYGKLYNVLQYNIILRKIKMFCLCGKIILLNTQADVV